MTAWGGGVGPKPNEVQFIHNLALEGSPGPNCQNADLRLVQKLEHKAESSKHHGVDAEHSERQGQVRDNWQSSWGPPPDNSLTKRDFEQSQGVNQRSPGALQLPLLTLPNIASRY